MGEGCPVCDGLKRIWGPGTRCSSHEHPAFDLEAVHDITMVVADSLQTYMERREGEGHPVGYLELKVGVVNAMECLFKFHQLRQGVLLIPRTKE